ncbi:HNH endonuclease [Xanthomonas cannabis]|uniref:HNH endonuclease n=1 Tax=Xanthomonas cannabis TaxID=1885674 RepID=UPI001111F69F|nr:HNH endonuclease [Xanthomonas cannabis]
MKANIQEPTNSGKDLTVEPELDGVRFFSKAITELSKHHNQYLSRLLRSDLLNMQTECGLCFAPLVPKSFPVVSLIVPIEQGGTQELGNAFLACKRCNERRGTSDLLSLGERFSCPAAPPSERSYGRASDFSPAALLARRLEILSRSANHWTPHTRNSFKHVVRAHLNKRWSEPRIRVFAHRSSNLALVGFGSRSGDAQSLGAARVLTKFLGADALPMGGFGQVFQVAPAQFLPLIWSLIEINALVVPVDIPGTERLALGDNWQDFWTDHVRSLSALGTRLRPGNAIDRQAFDRCPAAPRVLSQTRNSIQKREAYAPIKAMKESQRLALFHQKRIDEATKSGDFLAVIEARLASLM